MSEPLQLARSDLRMAGKNRAEMEAMLAGFGLGFAQRPAAGATFVTHCSATKGKDRDVAVPRDFYVSARNLRFYATCERFGLRYAILSDLYGLHMDDEELGFYDIHPSSVSEERLWELGQLIGEKAAERGITALHYVASPPSVIVPYLLMLFASGVHFTYSTRFLPFLWGLAGRREA